jgi:hypothetical protein
VEFYCISVVPMRLTFFGIIRKYSASMPYKQCSFEMERAASLKTADILEVILM